MLNFYRFCMGMSEKALKGLLERRAQKGKENRLRLAERQGKPSHPRPDGPLVWIHAASVGEAQSALIVIDGLLKLSQNLHILMTTGTTTSAALMAQKLPDRTLHQFFPLDHPDWADRFLTHWSPDLALWMESELWPNMLEGLKRRNIPAALVNARLSDRSFRRWRIFKSAAKQILGCFSMILTQTQKDADYFVSLGAKRVIVTDNLKFSAKPLPAAETDLKILVAKIGSRPLWLYASTHKGEEDMACRIHQILKNSIPDVLTIIVPRHPDRRDSIRLTCEQRKLFVVMRGTEKNLPEQDTDIYVADTIGELGLFYRVAPVACIGRSFSDDGGGGHNPIEAAQLNCAVLHGPDIQNLEEIYAEMDKAGAALNMKNEIEMTNTLQALLTDLSALQRHQAIALRFAKSKENVIQGVLKAITPLLEESKILQLQKRAGAA